MQSPTPSIWKNPDWLLLRAAERRSLPSSTKIKTAAEFVDLIDSMYRCDKKSKEAILKVIPNSDQSNFFFNLENSFLFAAAEKLSFRSLAYLVNSGGRTLFKPKFTPEMGVLPTFIANLQSRNVDRAEKMKIVKALRMLNKEETEKAIQNSSQELRDILYDIHQEERNFFHLSKDHFHFLAVYRDYYQDY